MNKHRTTLEHKTTKEQKSVLQPAFFNNKWKIVSHEIIEVRKDRATASPIVEDPELRDLALNLGLSVPDMLDKARAKFGTNINIKGLVLQIKVRGL